jgi:hypothetical protein
MQHVIFVLLVLLYINVIEAYFVSSLESEALQIEINTNGKIIRMPYSSQR